MLIHASQRQGGKSKTSSLIFISRLHSYPPLPLPHPESLLAASHKHGDPNREAVIHGNTGIRFGNPRRASVEQNPLIQMVVQLATSFAIGNKQLTGQHVDIINPASYLAFILFNFIDSCRPDRAPKWLQMP